jgi:hypothetical protein
MNKPNYFQTKHYQELKSYGNIEYAKKLWNEHIEWLSNPLEVMRFPDNIKLIQGYARAEAEFLGYGLWKTFPNKSFIEN